MGVFKLGKMTFGSLFKKPETVLYPIEKKPQPQGLKGHIVIDVDECILCGMCEKGCPTDCIKVDKEKHLWTITPFQCVQCGYCTRICPKSCLTMDPNYWSAATTKGASEFVIAENEKPAKAAASPAKKEENVVSAPIDSASSDSSDQVSVPSVIDAELEAKLAIMDDEKAERVRKALQGR